MKRSFVLIVLVIALGGCATIQQKGTALKLKGVVADSRSGCVVQDKELIALTLKIRNNYDQLVSLHKDSDKRIKELTIKLEETIKGLEELKAERKRHAERMIKILR